MFLRGTPIAANAQGSAEVEYQNGNAQIAIKAWNLPELSSLGPYTTYVVWALTPDGRAINQGVLASLDDKGELDTSYGASQFALIVTAEPHFAVGTPSDMITLYNVADDVEGEESKVTTLVERNDYSAPAVVPIGEDPLELAQARYAVAIAKAAGADRFAPSQYASATQSLTQAETALAGGRKDRKTATDSARAAVLAGEDARRAALAGADAEAERQRNAAAAAAATQEAQRAAALQARQDLRNRLNAALPTEETDRGLVSEVGGVQFATGTANLSASAREGLARFAGIVASYPGLRFNVEGHTDTTGSLATNNELSLRRASAVREYLIGQGIAPERIDVAGFGPSRPIEDNSTDQDARATVAWKLCFRAVRWRPRPRRAKRFVRLATSSARGEMAHQ